MAQPSDHSLAPTSSESPTDELCDVCGDDDAVSHIVARRFSEPRNRSMNICVTCLAHVLEQRTGFKFLAQLRNWRRLSAALKQSHKRRRAAKSAQKEIE